MIKQSISKTERKKHDPDWLRQFKGYEHYTDEQAQKELNSLDQLANILLKVTTNSAKG